jgi:hypothetical protein
VSAHPRRSQKENVHAKIPLPLPNKVSGSIIEGDEVETEIVGGFGEERRGF